MYTWYNASGGLEAESDREQREKCSLNYAREFNTEVREDSICEIPDKTDEKLTNKRIKDRKPGAGDENVKGKGANVNFGVHKLIYFLAFWMIFIKAK